MNLCSYDLARESIFRLGFFCFFVCLLLFLLLLCCIVLLEEVVYFLFIYFFESRLIPTLFLILSSHLQALQELDPR